MVMRRDLHCLHVDNRVFPDLRIDETAEGQREQAFQKAFLAGRLAAVHGLAEVGAPISVFAP